jgi:RHS repeat-associated protein
VTGPVASSTSGIRPEGLALSSDGINAYVYGHAQMIVEQVNNGTGAVQYLHHDQQGSTRMLTSSTGTVEGTATYDAYGNLSGTTGTATSPLGYDGQYTDPNTGLTHLRVRWYDPGTGQFMSVDPLSAVTRTPYTYAADDPLNHGDSSGLSCELTEPWDCVTEGAGTVVQVIQEHPVIIPILGCTVGVLVGESTCAASIAVGYGVATRNNIDEYLNGELSAEQLFAKQLSTAMNTVVDALPGLLASRITTPAPRCAVSDLRPPGLSLHVLSHRSGRQGHRPP